MYVGQPYRCSTQIFLQENQLWGAYMIDSLQSLYFEIRHSIHFKATLPQSAPSQWLNTKGLLESGHSYQAWHSYLGQLLLEEHPLDWLRLFQMILLSEVLPTQFSLPSLLKQMSDLHCGLKALQDYFCSLPFIFHRCFLH